MTLASLSATACDVTWNESLLAWIEEQRANHEEQKNAQNSDGGTVAVQTSLTSIIIKKNYMGDYLVNSSIDEGDITVTAIYSDGSTKELNWGDYTLIYDFSIVGNTKQIMVSYTESGVTKDVMDTTKVVAKYTGTYTFDSSIQSLDSYEGTYGASGTYVEFGDWPQTIKDPLVKIDESDPLVMGMFTYYMGSDGNRYCKVKESAYNTTDVYQYSNGMKVASSSVGSYKYFKVEKIKWRVLANDYTGADTSSTGKKLLLAENCLMGGVPYFDNTNNRSGPIYANNYEKSKIRAWLNGLSYILDFSGNNNEDHTNKGFFQTAFSASVQNKIQETSVGNDTITTGSNGNNTYACNNTTDKIFLLSHKELSTTTFFAVQGGNAQRKRKPTDFALANGCCYDGTSSSWWIRSPSSSLAKQALAVSNSGGFGASSPDYVKNVNDAYHGIVPALCVSGD